MNEFEKNLQPRSNDVNDSAIGFIASFVFFAVIFGIAVTIQVIGS
ncbi:YqzM family protein [Peribacillus loiseleuriae]